MKFPTYVVTYEVYMGLRAKTQLPNLSFYQNIDEAA